MGIETEAVLDQQSQRQNDSIGLHKNQIGAMPDIDYPDQTDLVFDGLARITTLFDPLTKVPGNGNNGGPKVDSGSYEGDTEIDSLDYDRNFISSDPYHIWYNRIKNIPLLTREQEQGLGKTLFENRPAKQLLEILKDFGGNDDEIDPLVKEKAAQYDAARKEMAESNLRLVASIARKYHVTRHMTLPDCIQEGNIGLLKAIDKFDYRVGCKFSTYATWWIRQAIMRGLGGQDNTVRIPIHMGEIIGKFFRASRQIEAESHRQPTDTELATKMNLSVEQVREIRAIYNRSHLESLDSPTTEDSDLSLGGVIKNPNAENPIKTIEEKDRKKNILNALRILPPRNRNIMILRFGLNGESPQTLDQIAKKYHLTRQRVSQVEIRSLHLLKADADSNGLGIYLED